MANHLSLWYDACRPNFAFSRNNNISLTRRDWESIGSLVSRPGSGLVVHGILSLSYWNGNFVAAGPGFSHSTEECSTAASD